MIYQHWTEDENYTGEDRVAGDDIFAPTEFFSDPKNAWQVIGLKFCCRVEADSWTEAMTKYHEHMEWEPYIPF